MDYCEHCKSLVDNWDDHMAEVHPEYDTKFCTFTQAQIVAKHSWRKHDEAPVPTEYIEGLLVSRSKDV